MRKTLRRERIGRIVKQIGDQRPDIQRMRIVGAVVGPPVVIARAVRLEGPEVPRTEVQRRIHVVAEGRQGRLLRHTLGLHQRIDQFRQRQRPQVVRDLPRMGRIQAADPEERHPPQRRQFTLPHRGRKLVAQQVQRMEITRTAQLLEAKGPQRTAVGPPLVMEPVVDPQRPVPAPGIAVPAVIQRQRQQDPFVDVHEIAGLLPLDLRRCPQRIKRLGHRVARTQGNPAADELRLVPAPTLHPVARRAAGSQVPAVQTLRNHGNLLRRRAHPPRRIRLRKAVFHEIGDQTEIRPPDPDLKVRHLLPRHRRSELQSVQTERSARSRLRKANLHARDSALRGLAHILHEFVPHTAPAREPQPDLHPAADRTPRRFQKTKPQRPAVRTLVVDPQRNTSVPRLRSPEQTPGVVDADHCPRPPVDPKRPPPQLPMRRRIAQLRTLAAPRSRLLRPLEGVDLRKNRPRRHQNQCRQHDQKLFHVIRFLGPRLRRSTAGPDPVPSKKSPDRNPSVRTPKRFIRCPNPDSA